jgi:hypothetical protein
VLEHDIEVCLEPTLAAIRATSASSAAVERGFSAGIEPMIPAWHCAITRSAVEAMNIGPAMTGMRNLARRSAARLTPDPR